MPTYLTPGVYVEEVPSTSKPIEGVSTSTAAFVGLAPGGPVNTPMRISNWTQFAKIYGDPVEPENGPFMDGAYLAHCVYGFFQNGGSLCWIVRVGKADSAGAPGAQAALPAATDTGIEALRVHALPGVDDQVKFEVAENAIIKNEGDGEGDKPATGGEPTYRITITAPGGAAEEYDGLTMKKGRNNLATKINAASKLVTIEETGASLPEAQRAPAVGSYLLSVPSVEIDEVEASDFAGDVAKRRGIGGLAAVDEITMVAIPDLWATAENGNGKVVKDLQGKLIAHCENAAIAWPSSTRPPTCSPRKSSTGA